MSPPKRPSNTISDPSPDTDSKFGTHSRTDRNAIAGADDVAFVRTKLQSVCCSNESAHTEPYTRTDLDSNNEAYDATNPKSNLIAVSGAILSTDDSAFAASNATAEPSAIHCSDIGAICAANNCAYWCTHADAHLELSH